MSPQFWRLACVSSLALIFSLAAGPVVIRWLHRSLRERIVSASERLNELHAGKKNTPTMGGVLIIAAICCGMIPVLVWYPFEGMLVMGAALLFGGLGAIDDWSKARRQTRGISVRQKLLGQLVISGWLGVALLMRERVEPAGADSLTTFIHGLTASPVVSIVWSMLVMISWSNAVNLTDGLDGLASGCTAIVAAALVGLSVGEEFEFTALGAAVVGAAAIGFLWFNRHPAKVFMGDTGSLSLGAALGILSLLSGTELILAGCGLVFVIETLSVIIQVAWFRRTGRRVLLCSPLHNHFVFRGVSERRIVAGFWCACTMCCLFIVGIWLF